MSPSADVLVREATQADVSAIAEVQVTTWRQAYGNILPPVVLASLDAAAIEAQWADSIALPGAGHALVAIEDGRMVGIAAAAPSRDDDADPTDTAEIGPLLVLPGAQGRGHGSRLLNAAVDLLRADGFVRALSWVFSGDTGTQTFYETAGWAPDGVTRDLDAAGTLVREVRLHTDLTSDQPTLDQG